MKLRSVFVVIMGLLTAGCTAVVSQVFPLADLQPPAGPYRVGTRIFDWTDAGREESFTEAPDDFRRLMVQVWYPAEGTAESVRQPYLDNPERRLDMVSYQSGLPKFLIRHMQNVQTNSWVDADALAQESKLPVVLFSHGLSGMKNQNTIQAELLASYGRVVISVDHAYDAYLTIFSDGSEADYRSMDRLNRTGQAFWDFRLPQLKTRASDLKFVLDEVGRLQTAGDPFWSTVSTQNVGVFGHSFGGATAILLASEDDRVGRVMALDGWMVPVPPEVIEAGLVQPFYYLGQSAWDDPINYKKLDKMLRRSVSGEKHLVAGTKHYDFCDAPQFSNLAKRFGLSGTLSRDALRTLVNDAVLSFFVDARQEGEVLESPASPGQ